ncbi:GTP cyclohydrolase FolE2 [Methylophaga sp. OBS4]|uniref:GTP cyclohydrolase FolE2 n=1 Tax=Methylophaga sp. OBS4 TaxID=2991935 RepID=UPI002255A99D|nr:GTP cyclohydrolase FolE2 [Methylophaga sp. OBS4]MCX4187087.1 GTP cyclohydrolase FolE2 [Methylophaga sp. OBS4]
MNLPLNTGLEDVQNTPDKRQLAIDQVGIKSLRYPIYFESDDQGPIRVVADFSMYVQLPHDVKGTHMSRFIELLERPQQVFSVGSMKVFMQDMLQLLEAEVGHVEMRFPFFISKAAPVSGVKSMMDYDVTLAAGMGTDFSLTVKAEIPVTSLCPCSKKISAYGAHNQRSLVTVEVNMDDSLSLDQLIGAVEEQASSQLYGLLKRPDEKYVTEFAYDNPKFVEDLVRDIAGTLDKNTAVSGFKVECENFESIHNHSAYAMIDRL